MSKESKVIIVILIVLTLGISTIFITRFAMNKRQEDQRYKETEMIEETPEDKDPEKDVQERNTNPTSIFETDQYMHNLEIVMANSTPVTGESCPDIVLENIDNAIKSWCDTIVYEGNSYFIGENDELYLITGNVEGLTKFYPGDEEDAKNADGFSDDWLNNQCNVDVLFTDQDDPAVVRKMINTLPGIIQSGVKKTTTKYFNTKNANIHQEDIEGFKRCSLKKHFGTFLIDNNKCIVLFETEQESAIAVELYRTKSLNDKYVISSVYYPDIGDEYTGYFNND